MVLLVIHENEIIRLLGSKCSKLAEYKQSFGVKIKVGSNGFTSKLIPVEIMKRPDSDEGMDDFCKQQIIHDLQQYADCYKGNRELIEAETIPESEQNKSGIYNPELIHARQPETASVSRYSNPTYERSNMSSGFSNCFDNAIGQFSPSYGFQTTRSGFGDDPWTKYKSNWGRREQGGFNSSTIYGRGSISGYSDNAMFYDEFLGCPNANNVSNNGGNRDYQQMMTQVRGFSLTTHPKTLPPIVKNFYKEHSEVATLSERQILAIRNEKNDVQVQDMRTENTRTPPKITTKFEHSLQEYPELLAEVRRNKFVEPSPIQCQMWPILFSGHDCIGIAQTGTGKTLAFLFPAFIHIIKQIVPRKERNGPTVLVLSPVRELAQQIEREVRKYNYKQIKSACLTGGNSRHAQVDQISAGVDIVIVTPGRMNDLIYSGDLKLDFVSYVVIDEADRMLDMGFEDQIRDMLNTVRKDKHTVMTSATWPLQVQELALKYMNEPFLVSIGSLDLKACHNVRQEVIVLQEMQKKSLLKTIMSDMKRDEKYLIFCSRKRTVDEVSDFLRNINCSNMKMHGDIMQSDRERALQYLKHGKTQVLVASDVAARGLDIMDITHVINYDMAHNNDDYVHRIGRTGRAGRKGVSVTFFTSVDSPKATKLVQVLEEANQTVPPELREMARSSVNYGGVGGEFHRYGNNSQPREFAKRSDRGRAREMIDPMTGEVIGTY